MSMSHRAAAEAIGTFWLVLGGCGSAVLAAKFPDVGIGLLGVSFAFGLTLLTMAFAIGHISGCHINPAVSLGLWSGNRFSATDLVPYIIAQVLGAVVAALVLSIIASGKPGFDLVASGFAANGYGEHSPGGYSLFSAAVCEVVMTYMFLLIILGATDKRAPAGFPAADRARPHPHPLDQHPGDEHVRESGAQHRAGTVRRWLGARTVVAILGGADRGRGAGGRQLPLAGGRRNGAIGPAGSLLSSCVRRLEDPRPQDALDPRPLQHRQPR
jgi:glycerol uptake facilitator-like aquaporin